MGLFDKIKAGLRKTADQWTVDLGSLFKGSLGVSQEILEEMEERLVMADVGSSAAKDIAKEVGESAKSGGKVTARALSGYLRDAVLKRLLKAKTSGELANPVVILLVGVNGAGKTTTAGKLACTFSSQGRKVLLAAGDTFRAAAEEQLTEWAQRAKVELVRGSHGAAPSAIVFDALKSGLSRGADCLVVDTAGRLHNRSNLMEELRKIIRVAEKAAPGIAQEKWLVLDANTGQNALNQAREFDREMGLTGIVLTKLDGTAKGGIVVALADQLGLAVKYLGVGEGLEDLVPFDAKFFAQALVPEPTDG